MINDQPDFNVIKSFLLFMDSLYTDELVEDRIGFNLNKKRYIYLLCKNGLGLSEGSTLWFEFKDYTDYKVWIFLKDKNKLRVGHTTIELIEENYPLTTTRASMWLIETIEKKFEFLKNIDLILT